MGMDEATADSTGGQVSALIAGQLRELCGHLPALLPVDGAAISLSGHHAGDDALGVLIAADERSQHLAGVEQALRQGPTYQAIETRGRVLVADVRTDAHRWPGFADAAVLAGVRAVAAYPLTVGDQVLGGIEFFRTAPCQPDIDYTAAATVVETVAALTYCGLQQSRDAGKIAQLDQALTRRVVIEQAKGMLAVSLDIDGDEAFEVLRRHARNRNRKVADLARELTERRTSPRAYAPDPRAASLNLRDAGLPCRERCSASSRPPPSERGRVRRAGVSASRAGPGRSQPGSTPCARSATAHAESGPLKCVPRSSDRLNHVPGGNEPQQETGARATAQPGPAGPGDRRRQAMDDDRLYTRLRWAVSAQADRGGLDRLAVACAQLTGARGAAITLQAARYAPSAVGTHPGWVAALEDVQLIRGQGPTLDCIHHARALHPSSPAVQRHWPEFAALLDEHGVRAVHALPLGDTRPTLGALTLYLAHDEWPTAATQTQRRAVADQTLRVLADLQHEHDGPGLAPLLTADPDKQREIHHAAGRIAAQLDCSLEEATVRLRAHAYRHGLALTETARRIIAGEPPPLC